jgi:hypothetical protein
MIMKECSAVSKYVKSSSTVTQHKTKAGKAKASPAAPNAGMQAMQPYACMQQGICSTPKSNVQICTSPQHSMHRAQAMFSTFMHMKMGVLYGSSVQQQDIAVVHCNALRPSQLTTTAVH